MLCHIAPCLWCRLIADGCFSPQLRCRPARPARQQQKHSARGTRLATAAVARGLSMTWPSAQESFPCIRSVRDLCAPGTEGRVPAHRGAWRADFHPGRLHVPRRSGERRRGLYSPDRLHLLHGRADAHLPIAQCRRRRTSWPYALRAPQAVATGTSRRWQSAGSLLGLAAVPS